MGQQANERQKAFRERQRQMGRKRCEFWLTPKERTLMAVKLMELRHNAKVHTK